MREVGEDGDEDVETQFGIEVATCEVETTNSSSTHYRFKLRLQKTEFKSLQVQVETTNPNSSHHRLKSRLQISKNMPAQT